MGTDVKQFLKTGRKAFENRPVSERIKDSREVGLLSSEEHSQSQAARCMDCGTPFCQWGCPVSNIIPEWNELVHNNRWEQAFQLLNSTNNLPEITGRVCPAPCEPACVLAINDDPVTIKNIELAIIEHGFKEGYIKTTPPQVRTGAKVAVIGSGPAGLSCADQLNKAGHTVVVFERDDKIGGLLRYGIPDFKLEKHIIDRRIDIWAKEGVDFRTNVSVGTDLPVRELLADFDAVCLTIGSTVPRDLNIEGRDLGGIHFAMEYLTQNNRRVAGETIAPERIIDAKDKQVVVIGGGDTGSDCIGTAHRQGARSILQIEVLPKPPDERTDEFPWPTYPIIFKISSSQEEGGERQWAVSSKRFLGAGGRVKMISFVKVEFAEVAAGSRPVMNEIPGSEFEIEADLVLLAIGFTHPQHNGLVQELGVELDKRGNIKVDSAFMTSVDSVFAGGDAHRGQSLVVWAINEGRKTAQHIDTYLMKTRALNARGQLAASRK